MEEFTISENLSGGITSLAEELVRKLNKEIEKGNDTQAFMIAMLLAAFKDFVDLVLTALLVGLFPGTTFVVGLFLTTFLYLFLLGKGWFLKWRIRLWYLFLGLFVDGLPGFSALPINTLLVLYSWRLARRRKTNAEVKLAEIENLTGQEMSELNNDISLLEKGNAVRSNNKNGTRTRTRIYNQQSSLPQLKENHNSEPYSERMKKYNEEVEKKYGSESKRRIDERNILWEDQRQKQRKFEEGYGVYQKYDKDLSDLKYKYRNSSSSPG